MAFDFFARAEARIQKEAADRRRVDEAYKIRCERTESLVKAFVPYAKQVLYREKLNFELDGPTVTLQDGQKRLRLDAMDNTHFRMRKASLLGLDGDDWDDGTVFDNDEALTDALDAWAQKS
ncbi:hypothetical protein [Lichenibacterium ramalinae]|uniref:hypothetical protein n=1 Tax=Lichenibacterium ramalinae TaxID=2316527 RepID=UPI00100EB516|nr:hypothetical protein [Lichenibacterium ramalinae]